jgi:hypothetical protein
MHKDNSLWPMARILVGSATDVVSKCVYVQRLPL